MSKIKVFNANYIKYHVDAIDFFSSRYIDAFANNNTTQEHRMFQPCENSAAFNEKLRKFKEKNLVAGYIEDKVAVLFCDSFSSTPLNEERLEKFQYILIINDIKLYHSLKRSILEGMYHDYFEFCE